MSLLLAVLPLATLAPPIEDKTLAELVPADVFAYAETARVHELFAQGLEHPLVARLLDGPLGEVLLAELPMRPEDALGLAEAFYGRPILPDLAQLTGGGVAIGVGARGSDVHYALAIRGDVDLWEDTIDLVLEKIAAEYDADVTAFVNPHKEVRGVPMWFIGDDLTFALHGGTVLASNDRDRVRDMIDLALDGGQSIGSHAGVERARAYLAGAPFVWAWGDIDALEQSPDSELDELRALAGQPAPHFLLGPVLANIGTAGAAVAALHVEADRLGLTLTGLDFDDGPATEVLLPLDGQAPKLPAALAGEAARALLYRDLDGLMRLRTELFPAEIQPNFAEAISNLALFFGGEDIGDDILPNMSPWLGAIVRDVTFDPQPDVPLPAAALIAQIADPDVMGPKLKGAFQTLIGVINLESAQAMRPALVMDLELAGQTTVMSARYPRPVTGDGVDIRYNLVPACAIVGDSFVLGTHVDIVKEVVLQIERGEVVEMRRGNGDRLDVSGAALVRLVQANEEALVMNGVLNEGKQMEQARKEIEVLTGVLSMLDTLEATFTRPKARDLQLDLSLKLTPWSKSR